MRNKTVSPQLGRTSGLRVHYKISDRFLLESGTQFSDKGFKLKIPDNKWVTSEDIIKRALVPFWVETPISDF